MVWKADYSPFGKASITSQGPTFNLRFPGQYYDAETGLHYNWHRYYDPGTGRYITSDPIGLAGGINTYTYVKNNPVHSIDPTGLIEWTGTFRLASVSFPAGVGIGYFNLQSKCVNGIEATANLFFIGAAVSIGPKFSSLSGSEGSISFEDNLDQVQPWVLEGTAGILSAGAQVGKGLSFGKTRLGDAFERQATGENRKGIEFGIGAVFGSSTLYDYSIKDCACE